MSKNDLISLFIENNAKVKGTITDLRNKLAKVSENVGENGILSVVSKTVNNSFRKQLIDL